MRLSYYLRQMAAHPPHVTVRRAAAKIGRAMRGFYQRQRDQRRPTYTSIRITAPLHRCFPAPVPDALNSLRADILDVWEQYRAHRFDLLGSGWVQVRHGMVCAGVEGHVYPPHPPVTPDRDGRWLEGRINPANVMESRRIWALVDADYIPIDWHIDFKSGYRWDERTPAAQIAYGHLPGVDVKVPWELARAQHLPHLAYAAVLSDDRQPYAREFRNQVLDFIATNPPRFGVNWACTMDVSIRAVNWLAAYDMLRAAGISFDEAFEIEFKRSLYSHGRHIVTHLEWGPDLRSNHYLSNVAGLLFVAAYLPPSAEIDAWLAFAVQELVAEVGTQFTPDGANFEASTSYHRLSAEMVIYATAIALGLAPEKMAALQTYNHRLHRGRGQLQPAPLPLYAQPGTSRQSPFPAWYMQRLERMAEFTMHITRPDGVIPQIGDNDSGRFLKLQPLFDRMTAAQAQGMYTHLEGYTGLAPDALYLDEKLSDHRHLVAAINGLFAREDFAVFAAGQTLETGVIAWVSRRALVASSVMPGQTTAAEQVRIGDAMPQPEAAAHLSLSIPAPGSSLLDGLRLYGYPDFGLYIFQSARLYLALRCGPVGQNSSGGHAHNDQLSIELLLDGQVVFCDPGTHLYTPLPQRRNQYRSARAHFVPRLDSEPASLSLGPFRLEDRAQARCLYFGPEGFAGMHRGYGQPVYRLVRIAADAVMIDDYGPAGLVNRPEPIAFSPGYGKALRVSTDNNF